MNKNSILLECYTDGKYCNSFVIIVFIILLVHLFVYCTIYQLFCGILFKPFILMLLLLYIHIPNVIFLYIPIILWR
jgi:hypothetical protein